MAKTKPRPKGKLSPAQLPKPAPDQPTAEESTPVVAEEPVPLAEGGPTLYRVTAACTDFEGHYREAGELVLVEAGKPIPKWFQKVEDGAPQAETTPPKPEEPKTLSELTKRLANTIIAPGTTVL